MTNKELISKIREEILHLKMKELQRTNGINTGADVYLSSYAVLSILSNALTEESEDERIRKEIIDIVEAYRANCVYEGTHRFDDCLAYLEKQKEQKPNIELIQRSWYMEGYHDRQFGKEPKWIIKTGEGGPKHELNPRYGQHLVDEQKPTEEQLHNLNEAIKGLRMDGCERIADSLHSLYNILKTQEQKPWKVGANAYFTPEQKPELVQQPPITYTYNSNASRDERLKAALLALLNSDLLKVKEGGYFTKQDLIEWVERIPTDKPVEWSEQDEKMRDSILAELANHICYNKPLDGMPSGTGWTSYKYQQEMDWLTNRLKSIRPGWKPTEEQMEALNKARRFIPYNCDILESLYEQLKKL